MTDRPAVRRSRSNRRRARRVLPRVLAGLRRAYGPRKWASSGSGVGELVATILSQNTSAANSTAGFRRLWRRFRSWPAVANAPVEEIERCIRVSGLSNVKAPRIRGILRQIRETTGRVSLEFLADWPDERAYEYLLAFDGVGPKTAACVLMFAFGKPLFPVDTHIVRIAIRLGLLAGGTGAEKAQELLTPLIAPADRYEMHLLLIAHGRRTCRARNPHCHFCPILPLCPTGRKRGHSIPPGLNVPFSAAQFV